MAYIKCWFFMLKMFTAISKLAKQMLDNHKGHISRSRRRRRPKHEDNQLSQEDRRSRFRRDKSGLDKVKLVSENDDKAELVRSQIE
jgi:hypothetical protein